MSKEILVENIENIRNGKYVWTLYFIKINHKLRGNPFYTYKHTFRNPQFLADYAVELSNTMLNTQVKNLENVQSYNGENSKTSCDKISTENELISEQWNELTNSVIEAPREQISGKYQGYILDGQPVIEGLAHITLFKAGNPVISLDNKNTKVFKHDANDQLDEFTDEICRLYLNADFLVIGNQLYAFNLVFEGLFRIEKTMHKLKLRAIDNIIDTGAFENKDEVQSLMMAYPSPKTFLTLHSERVNKLNSIEGRMEVANRLKLDISPCNELKLSDQKKVNMFIKYLCYKIFQDKETDNLIEVNSVVTDNVLS